MRSILLAWRKHGSWWSSLPRTEPAAACTSPSHVLLNAACSLSSSSGWEGLFIFIDLWLGGGKWPSSHYRLPRPLASHLDGMSAGSI